MEDKIQADFDHAFDNFIDYLSNDTTTGSTEVSLQTHVENESENELCSNPKKEIAQATIKVMKNDIRRYFSRMFMNTVNSGDFNHLQSYLSTFMLKPAKFLVNYDEFDSIYRLPQSILADGPKLVAHYFLGVFVMCPDTVTTLTSSRIVTSNAWAGTKIEIDVEIFATKVFDLSIDEWIPQLQVLEEKCRVLSIETRKSLNNNKFGSTLEEVGSHALTLSSSDCASVIRDTLVIINSSDACGNATDDTSAGDGGIRHSRRVKQAVTNRNNNELRDAVDKRKRRKTPTAARTDESSASKEQEQAPPIGSESHNDTDNNNIPEEYVHALCKQATLLPVPVTIHMAATLTMFLDENHHIEHIHVLNRSVQE